MLSGPRNKNSSATGPSHSGSPDSDDLDRTCKRRPGMIRDMLTEQIIVLAVGGVTAHGIAQTIGREADDRRGRHDEREGDGEEEQRDESRGRR